MELEQFIQEHTHESNYVSHEYAYKWYRGVADYLLEAGLSEAAVVKLFQLRPIDVARLWKYAGGLTPEMLGVRWLIPRTEEQAFVILDGIVSAEDMAVFRSQTKSEFVGDQHFGLGNWIRNNWIYGPEEEEDKAEEALRDECFRMLAGMKKEDVCFEHPDEVSGRFLERYYDHLIAVANNG